MVKLNFLKAPQRFKTNQLLWNTLSHLKTTKSFYKWIISAKMSQIAIRLLLTNRAGRGNMMYSPTHMLSLKPIARSKSSRTRAWSAWDALSAITSTTTKLNKARPSTTSSQEFSSKIRSKPLRPREKVRSWNGWTSKCECIGLSKPAATF